MLLNSHLEVLLLFAFFPLPLLLESLLLVGPSRLNLQKKFYLPSPLLRSWLPRRLSRAQVFEFPLTVAFSWRRMRFISHARIPPGTPVPLIISSTAASNVRVRILMCHGAADGRVLLSFQALI